MGINHFSYVPYGKSGNSIKISTILQKEKTRYEVFSEALRSIVILLQQFHREFSENVVVENYIRQNILTCEFLRMLLNHISTLPSAFV